MGSLLSIIDCAQCVAANLQARFRRWRRAQVYANYVHQAAIPRRIHGGRNHMRAVCIRQLFHIGRKRMHAVRIGQLFLVPTRTLAISRAHTAMLEAFRQALGA